jgi:alkylation response protein AidB-like acyl-CoA dehydrogenase
VKVFAEHHEMFRATVRAFVEREVMPHVEAWEAAGRIPKTIWPRMGELGLLGVEYDEKCGGAGADLLTTAVLHEECARSRSGSFAMAVGVNTDMASPHLYWTGITIGGGTSEIMKEIIAKELQL